MRTLRIIWATIVVGLTIWTATVQGETEYVGQWAVQIKGGEDVARRVARETGFEFDRQVGTVSGQDELLL